MGGVKNRTLDYVDPLTGVTGHRVIGGINEVDGTAIKVQYDDAGIMTGKMQDGVQYAYGYDGQNRMTSVTKDGLPLQTMGYDFSGKRIIKEVHKRADILTTLYSSNYMEIRTDSGRSAIRVTKMIYAGQHGKLATFGEQFSENQLNAGTNYLAYANRYDKNDPMGYAMALGYGILAKMSRPEVAKRVPLLFFLSISLAFLSLWAWSLIQTKRAQIGFQSRFRPMQRACLSLLRNASAGGCAMYIALRGRRFHGLFDALD